MKNYFLDLVKIISSRVSAQEKFTAYFSAETLDFARFNQGKIRQAGSLDQAFLAIDLSEGQKHATITIGLYHNLATDQEAIGSAINQLREHISSSATDPYFMIHEGNTSTTNVTKSELSDKREVVNSILELYTGLDLVGYYFGGPIYKGFASSFNQINWFEKSSFVLDTSVYHSGDKAVKQSYADLRFNKEVLREKIENARLGLSLFDNESITVKKGNYRVYFSPNAVFELLSMINWGGFSRKSLEVKDSPLLPLFNGQKTFSPDFSFCENIKDGVGPNFQSQGFMKPDSIPIIEKGHLKNVLISPKTAKEYNLDHNGADDNESMCAMDMKAGSLLDHEILSTLDDGLYINNLWYLNFSDRQNACVTGMTRFFCFVVKNKKPQAPFSVMRFDDSIYRILGENLTHVTKSREMIIDSSTYDERSTACAILPGIIAENVRFTL